LANLWIGVGFRLQRSGGFQVLVEYPELADAGESGECPLRAANSAAVIRRSSLI
jgi:hypothetical protein